MEKRRSGEGRRSIGIKLLTPMTMMTGGAKGGERSIPTKADVFQKAGEWLGEYFSEMIRLLEVVRVVNGVPVRVRTAGEWNHEVICKEPSIAELMKFCFAFYYFPKLFGTFLSTGKQMEEMFEEDYIGEQGFKTDDPVWIEWDRKTRRKKKSILRCWFNEKLESIRRNMIRIQKQRNNMWVSMSRARDQCKKVKFYRKPVSVFFLNQVDANGKVVKNGELVRCCERRQ
jgi:hypothetical protein